MYYSPNSSIYNYTTRVRNNEDICQGPRVKSVDILSNTKLHYNCWSESW